MMPLERVNMMQKLIYIVAVALLASIGGFVYAESIQEELADNLVRFHVLANSDSEADQAIKLQVRDAILATVRGQIDTNAGRQAVLDSVEVFERTANETLQQLGADYTARVEVERVYFPKKIYDNITLPRGRYESIRVLLGRGAGENWWCVAYPPLCFTEAATGALSDKGQELLRERLSEESYDVIQTEGVEVQYKFKVVELFNTLKEKLL